MNITKFELSHKAKLNIITTSKIKLKKHRPRRSSDSQSQTIKDETQLPEYEPLNHDDKDLAKTFEDLISWCIHGKIQKLKSAVANENDPIFKDLIQFEFDCVDLYTGHNIFEFTAISGHVDVMKLLLELRKSDEDYFTMGKALKYAIVKENVNMVKCILEFSLRNGISFGLNGYGTAQDLCLAIELDKMKIVEVFLNYAHFKYVGLSLFNFNHVFEGEDPQNALLLASKLGRLEIVKLLVTKKANLNTKGGLDNKTALHLSAENGHFEIVEFLLEQGANIFEPDLKNRTAWHLTKENLESSDYDLTKEYLKKVLQLLSTVMKSKFQDIPLDYKANLISPDYEFQKVQFIQFISDIINGEEAKVRKALLKCPTYGYPEYQTYDISIHAQDYNTGYQALDFAVLKGHTEIIKLLLENGAKIDIINHTALDLAITQNHNETVKLLFQHGVQSKHRFYLAIKKGLLEVAENYIHEVDINDLNDDDELNALHQATIQDQLDLVKFLIGIGSDVNKKSGHKGLERSALHFAAENDNFEMVAYLLEQGADMFQKDIAGLNALEIVMKGCKIDYFKSCKRKVSCLKEELEENDAKIETSNYASKAENKLKLIKFLSTKMGLIIDEDEEEISKNKRKLDDSEDQNAIAMMNHLTAPLLNKYFPMEGKIFCISAIDSLIAKDLEVCDFLVKKDIIDELAVIAKKIIYQVGNQPDKDLATIARILAKVNEIQQGKDLISDINLPFGTFNRLKTEMMKFDLTSNQEP